MEPQQLLNFMQDHRNSKTPCCFYSQQGIRVIFHLQTEVFRLYPFLLIFANYF